MEEIVMIEDNIIFEVTISIASSFSRNDTTSVMND